MLFEQILKNGKKEPPSLAHSAATLEKARARHGQAIQRLEECRHELAEATLAELAGGERALVVKAQAAHERAEQEEALARMSIEAAEAIHKAATEADRTEKRNAQVQEIAGYAAQRAAVAVDIGGLATALCGKWRDLLELSAKMENAGIPLPAGAMTRIDELRPALEHELYRLGAHPQNTSKSFPGGRTPSFMFTDQPEAIPPLIDKIRQATANTLATLRRGDHV